MGNNHSKRNRYNNNPHGLGVQQPNLTNNNNNDIQEAKVSVKEIDGTISQNELHRQLLESLDELPDHNMRLTKDLVKDKKQVLEEDDTEEPQADDVQVNKTSVGDVQRKVILPDNNKWFKVIRREVRDDKTGHLVNIETELEIKDPTMQQALTSFGIILSYHAVPSGIFGGIKNIVRVPVERLLIVIETFKNNQYLSVEMRKLVDWLEEEHKRSLQKAEKLISKGKISFDTLHYLFPVNGKFFASAPNELVIGAQIVTVRYNNSLCSMFEISGKSIKSNGQLFFDIMNNYTIWEFRGVMDILRLKQQPMTEDMLKVLHKRGKMFKKVALGHHFKHYEGFLVINKMWGSNRYKAEGRVMVDLTTFERMNPDYQVFKNPNGINTLAQISQNMGYNNNYYQANNSGIKVKLNKEVYFMTWPTVAGFSFACKRWGEVIVDQLSDIVFDDLAFERLVLPTQKKHLVQALVEQHQKTHSKKVSGFSDIISGKGGGCIFLLHGPPGTGKTLTSESIAEHLHQPLYSVTVGELGTNTKDLEAKLQEILELSSIWNAVILIDEADIFLERRSDNDIVRNAMVGIFLRLLEYHQGVLFLTTNRVKSFDEAFHSRISVALKYDELDMEAREQVWENLFSAAKITTGDARSLSQHVLNGRQIRNVIQLAQALAAREGISIDMSHISRTVQVATQFQNNLSWESIVIVDSKKENVESRKKKNREEENNVKY